MKKIAILICLFCAAVFIQTAFGETLYLKNGTVHKGHILKQDDEKLIFMVGGADDGVEVTFFKDEVLRIDKAEVSNFITLPFGETQQIDIPRPIFNQTPVITEQVKTQKKQRSQTQAFEAEKNETDASVETEIQAQPEEYSQDPVSDIEAKLHSQEGSVTEELTKLLDVKEKDYFMSINSMVQGVAGKMAGILTNPDDLLQGGQEALAKLVQDMPEEIDAIIVKMGNLQMPELFTNFHEKYLSNLSLMKDIFLGISRGDIQNSQSKMQDLKRSQVDLQEELRKILEIKKS